MIGTNKYKRPAVLIFIFDKVERQIHFGNLNEMKNKFHFLINYV